jgi:hypothetical protein
MQIAKSKAVPLHTTKTVGGRGGIAPLILDLGARRGEWSASRPGCALAPGKWPSVPIGQEAGWAPELVCTQRLEEKSFRLCRGSNLYLPVVQRVARYSTDWDTRLTQLQIASLHRSIWTTELLLHVFKLYGTVQLLKTKINCFYSETSKMGCQRRNHWLRNRGTLCVAWSGLSHTSWDSRRWLRSIMFSRIKSKNSDSLAQCHFVYYEFPFKSSEVEP